MSMNTLDVNYVSTGIFIMVMSVREFPCAKTIFLLLTVIKQKAKLLFLNYLIQFRTILDNLLTILPIVLNVMAIVMINQEVMHIIHFYLQQVASQGSYSCVINCLKKLVQIYMYLYLHQMYLNLLYMVLIPIYNIISQIVLQVQ